MSRLLDIATKLKGISLLGLAYSQPAAPSRSVKSIAGLIFQFP